MNTGETRYVIPPNHGVSTPASLLFVDTETDSQMLSFPQGAKEQRLRLWVAVTVRLAKGKVVARKVHRGKTADDFWRLVSNTTTHRRPLLVIAHNCIFDLTTLGLWRELEHKRFKLSDLPSHARTDGPELTGKVRAFRGVMILNDPPVIMMFRTDRGVVKFLDTYNWFQCSLKQLGDDIGLPKLCMPSSDDDEDAWWYYCTRDVEIIEKACCDMFNWVRTENMGTWKYTAAGQAFAAWRHRFNAAKVQIHRDEDALELEREAYYGGETKCNYHGNVVPRVQDCAFRDGIYVKDGLPCIAGPVCHLDVNSLYPSVMHRKLYPIRLAGTEEQASLSKLETLLKHFGAVARVSINTKHWTFPCRHDKRTVYISGEFKTCLAGPELQQALKTDSIRRVYEVNVYDMGDIFSRFVEHFYEHKEECRLGGHRGYYLFYKLCLNGLYGKFAQKQPTWVDAPGVACPDPWGHFGVYDTAMQATRSYRAIGWYAQAETEGGEARYSFPAIAAYVTSYARVRMRELREAARECNVLYQDTDSLHCLTPGVENLGPHIDRVKYRLGSLKIVDWADEVVYYGLKDYRWGTKNVVAGVKEDAVWRDGRTVVQEEWERADQVIGRGRANTIRIVPRMKSLPVVHPGGMAYPDGRVRPYVMVDGELR